MCLLQLICFLMWVMVLLGLVFDVTVSSSSFADTVSSELVFEMSSDLLDQLPASEISSTSVAWSPSQAGYSFSKVPGAYEHSQ